jgi:hypothetical protein
MLDIMKQFLAGNATPALQDAIKDAYTILERCNAGDIDFSFEDMLMIDDIVDAGTTIGKMTHFITDLQHGILGTFGVEVDAELTIADLTMFIRAILDIEDYEDSEALVRITMGELRPDESFAEIVALMSHHNADELLYKIERVDASLIRRIQDVASATDDELVTDEERLQRSKYVHMLRRFCHYINSRQLTVVDMIRDGIAVGYPFSVYADQIGRAFEGIVPEHVAKEMIAMALVSSDGINNPTSTIKAHLENYVADLNTITKIDIEVKRLLQGFSRD